MALFKISKGPSDKLSTSNSSKFAREGSAWFTPDDGKFYIDIAGDGTSTSAVIGTNRIALNASKADFVGHVLSISLNGGSTEGTNSFTYNGSETKTIDITPALIGAQAAGNYKTVQTAITDTNATTDGSGITFVKSVTQNTNGVITVVKTNLDTSGTWSGNAATASKLATARTISLTGSVTGSGTFDGSGNLSIATTTNHNHDSVYKKIQTAVSDPNASGTTITVIDTISQNTQGVISVTKKTIRDASASQSGVVSTGTQTFAGAKTFSGAATFSSTISASGILTLNSDADSANSQTTTSSLVVKGGASIAKQLSAKIIRIDNAQTSEGVTLVYDNTNDCLNFVFV